MNSLIVHHRTAWFQYLAVLGQNSKTEGDKQKKDKSTNCFNTSITHLILSEPCTQLVSIYMMISIEQVNCKYQSI